MLKITRRMIAAVAALAAGAPIARSAMSVPAGGGSAPEVTTPTARPSGASAPERVAIRGCPVRVGSSAGLAGSDQQRLVGLRDDKSAVTVMRQRAWGV